MVASNGATALVISYVGKVGLESAPSEQPPQGGNELRSENLTPREMIKNGVDPETNERLSPEQWYMRLVMMTATLEEYELYKEWSTQASNRYY